ncbi:hypothetical protein D9619_005740 [Psilocybe cf. subviscida]|uniref:Uncharacterized protein n=1 Tax=Psilocybe cf. subviscida TaxID=2480587 RepID=A0A8H5BXL3_9AGAR|nr:hypothetical protein D9619_005740 [Psilocybe cf. subviscida]
MMLIPPLASLMHTRTRPLTTTTNTLPPFPPPDILLHPDDASSKVFLAIARAFVSVDNCAMTIKDMAERASHYGLVCQNLSAAAQAITTYLRAHKTRCDKEQDQPLLLSHTLSGTPADDDLVPALHSRSGGDSHPLENRLTNFRRGTAVWYLSRATGVPCPFTRAGIRLCDYHFTPDPTTAPRERRAPGCERKSARVAVAGEKRKRPLRTPMTITGADSENERPPKVKLTLRLKPLIRPPVAKPDTPPTPPPAAEEPEGSTPTRPIDVSDAYDSDGGGDEDESDSMSIDSSSPSSEEEDDDLTHTATLQVPDEPVWQPCSSPALDLPRPEYSLQYLAALKRSPSLPFATPPPDSDDEMSEDYHVAMTRINDEEDDELGWDADLDSEGEEDTIWESPGPRSPSAPLLHPPDGITVKQEPQDVQGMLDAWEDFDTNAAVADVIAKAFETAQPTIKTEPVESWEWDASQYDTSIVKQEDFGVDLLFPPGLSSPLTSLANQFAAFSYSDNPSDEDPSPALSRRRAKTVPAPTMVAPPLSRPSISSSGSPPVDSGLPSNALAALLQTMSVEPGTPLPMSAFGSTQFAPPHENTHGQGRLSLPTPCVSPLQTRCQPSFPENQVVVTTTQPSDPPVSATQIEDISVYQMMLCAFQLLRRIDTDWVNLSPIIALAGASPADFLESDTLTGAAVVITKGSPQVCGTWVPLTIAQQFVNRHSTNLAAKTPSGETAILAALEVFLSDNLVKLFPPALEEFHRTVTRAPLQQFGKHFASTLQATQWASESGIDLHIALPPWAAGAVMESPCGSFSSLSPPPLSASSSVSASPPPSDDGLAGTPLGLDTQQYIFLGDKHEHPEEVPLSAKEREIFHELCVIPPDWERDSESGNCADAMAVDGPSSPCKLRLDTSRPPTPATARPTGLVVRTCSGKDSGSMYALSDESPLSSPLSSPTLSAWGIASPPLSPTSSKAFTSRLTAAVTPTTTTTNDGRPLRRSKRVADAATQRAPPPKTRARSRKRASASRNSLS